MTFQQILDRDVPLIVGNSRALAIQGIVGDMLIYYRHEEITGVQSGYPIAALEHEGWKSANVSIPSNVPWINWNIYLRNRLGNCPLFA